MNSDCENQSKFGIFPKRERIINKQYMKYTGIEKQSNSVSLAKIYKHQKQHLKCIYAKSPNILAFL